jgi:hypothetical protein
MRYVLAFAAVLSLGATLAGPAPAQERAPGELSVLLRGYWSCAVPGSATGEAREVRPALDFETIRGSRYRVGEEIGIYLRLGDRVEMTTGPFKGRVFSVTGADSIREIEGGAETPVRCLRRPA